jgi:hypothetical protein
MRGTAAIKNMLWLVMPYMLLLAPGCKKCYTCKNTCVHCVRQTSFIDICNTDYSVPTAYDDAKKAFTDANFNCTELPSSESFEYCDDKTTANNLMEAYERLRYSCE